MSTNRKYQLFRYSFATFTVVAACLLTYFLTPLAKRSPFLLFVVAVLLSVWRGGLGAGLTSTAISVMFLAYLFLPSFYSLQIDSSGELVRLSVFSIVSLVITFSVALKQRAERQLFMQATLLDQAQDAILVCDANENISYWNKGAEHLYGWTAQEAVGKNADELLYQSGAYQINEVKQILAAKGEWRGELNQVTKRGREIIVESHWTIVGRKQDSSKAKLVVNTDITEKKRLEAEAVRSAQLSLVIDFAAGFADQIKNPLAGIQACADLMMMNLAPEAPERTSLEKIRQGVSRIDERVNELLSRSGHYALNVKLASASLSEAVKRAVTSAHKLCTSTSSLEKGQVFIDYETPSNPFIMPIDSLQIQEAVFNLLKNAIEASKDGGHVTVRVSCNDGYGDEEGNPTEIAIEVSDQGDGIAETHLHQIFTPFFTTKRGATGLGLQTVRRITQAHSGRVKVKSSTGYGSTVSLHLPIAKF